MKKFEKNMNLFKLNLKKKMGIDDFRYSPKVIDNFKRSELRELEIELNTKGRDINLKDLDASEDSTIEYMGKKVILYIRDQYVPNKYHISWCDALQKMKNQGRINRYVVSTRKDGIFSVNQFDPITKKLISENNETKMDVCVWCLGKLKYKGFVYGETSSRRAVSNFKLKEFFQKYETTFNGEETSLIGEGVQPLNSYAANWNKISKAYRQKMGWYCEKCGKDLNNKKGGLEVHHIDRNKFNPQESNLIALCHECHKKEHENDY